MSEPVTLEKLDVRFTELLTTMKEGFEKAASDLASVKTDLQTEIASVKTDLRNEFDAKIDDVLIAVKAGFDETASKAELETVRTELKTEIASVKTDLVEVGLELRTVQATMVTKSYLDEKLANLNGDLTVKYRGFDGKIECLISVLENQKIISKDVVKHIHSSFKIFPTLPDTAS